MRPKDMTVTQRPTGGWAVTFENARELVIIEGSPGRLNEWARRIISATSAAAASAGDDAA